MSKIIEIKNCKQCPHHRTGRDYTEDSFEFVSKWVCAHDDGPKEPVRRYVDWNDKVKEFIPDECPLQDKEKKDVNKHTGRNLPEEITLDDLDNNYINGLTVGALKELIYRYNLPADGKVLIERIEDFYYENNSWGVVYKEDEQFREISKHLTDIEIKHCMDQYHPAWYACKFKDDDKNLYICLH
jgi:hypothetical protein